MSVLYATLEDLVKQKKALKSDYKIKVLKASGFDNGEIKSSFKGRGLEFEEIREYVFGDDVRDIDWRVSARKNEPYTKVYSIERDVETFVLLDLSQSMLFGTQSELKSVKAAKICALLGWMALENKDKFGLIIFDGYQNYVYKSRSGLKQFMAILQKISEISQSILENNQEQNISISSSLSLLQQHTKSDGVCFIISDFSWLDDEIKEKLLPIFKKSQTTLIKISDSLEHIAPPSGVYLAEFNEQKVLINSSPDYQKKYQEYFAQKQKALEGFCTVYGAKLLES